MRFRKLRIAWSVGWGLLAVLLVLLWVRSFWHIDIIEIRKPFPAVALGSGLETTLVRIYRQPMRSGWSFHSYSTRNQPKNEDAILGFSYVLSDYDLSITMPHWFVASFIAIVAVLVWFSWRFSLRALLIATTLLAMLLGLTVFATRR
jgi:hypothetical protein